MSEEILRALIQLFALTAKQDGGIEDKELQYVESFLIQQLGVEAAQEWLLDFKKQVGLILDEKALRKQERERKKQLELEKELANNPEARAKMEKDKELTSVRESVKILGICKKINKNINQQQKIVVYVRLFELVNTSKKFTEQRMAIINTVGEVFNINPDAAAIAEGAQDVLKDSKAFVENNDSMQSATSSTFFMDTAQYLVRMV